METFFRSGNISAQLQAIFGQVIFGEFHANPSLPCFLSQLANALTVFWFQL
jgi:hypothetical protein